MDFGLSEEQEAVRDLAAQIFQGSVTVEKVKAVEASDDRIDRDLWKALADANLLGISLPEDVGGSGLGFTELTLVLEQQGRVVAPVPYWATVVCGALPIAQFGSPDQRERWLPAVVQGDAILSAALAEIGVNDPLHPQLQATQADDGAEGAPWLLNGLKISVPVAPIADALVVPAMTPDGLGVFLVDTSPDSVVHTTAVTTDRSLVGHVTFTDAPAEPLGDLASGERVTRWILDRALLGLAAISIGVCEEAVRMAAEYTNGREQFGKPLASFQGAQIKAADAYIDTECIRVTTQQAAWKLDEGRDASSDVLVAKWWASEAGQHAVHMTQHLHGGMGADIDYPVHRYFLWGKQIEDTLGGASATLARLGAELTSTGAAR